LEHQNKLEFKMPSFGGCSIAETSTKAAELRPRAHALNLSMRFEEGLKLHLALGDCLTQLNRAKRDSAADAPDYFHFTVDLENHCLRVHQGDAPATKASFQNKPMPSKRKELPIERRFTYEEVVQIAKGHIPDSMDDKWFLYFDPTVLKLFIHRSWTGYCVYTVHFRQVDDWWAVSGAWVNRDPEQYEETNLQRDAAIAEWLIDVLLLDRRRDFPSVLADDSSEEPNGKRQSDPGVN